MRPNLDATLIGELRQRVIRHNEAHPKAKAKLGDLIKAYERGYRRSNPGLRAMEKVDGLLNVLAKADEFDTTKHPRGHGGEFSAGAALPASRSEHRALQAGNAGYKAVTTDVIPERRAEATGALLRDVGSLAAGATLVGSLARSRPGGIGERVAGAVTGTAAGLAGGGAATVAGQALHLGSRALHGVIRKAPVYSSAKANAFRDKTAGQSFRAGAKVGRFTGRMAGKMVQGAVRTAGGSGAPTARAGRKALAFGALSIAAGGFIRNRIKDSIVDPQGWGSTLDGYGFRSVQKAVGASAELETLRKGVTAHLSAGGPAGGSIDDLRGWLEAGAGDYDGLAKVGWGPGITRLFTGAAAAVGAGAGAGAGYYASRATQNRGNGDGKFEEDEHPRATDGKFTSKSGRDHRFAQVGGLLGGAAAGIGALLAIRSHNARGYLKLRRSMVQILTNRRQNDGLPGGKSALSRYIGESDKRAAEKVANDPAFAGHRSALAAVDDMRGSSVPMLQQKVRNSYFRKIANVLLSHEGLRVPNVTGKGSKTVNQVKAEVAMEPVQKQHVHWRTVDALQGADEAGLAAMTAHLPEESRAKVIELYHEAHARAGLVEEQLAGHSEAVTAATEALQAHRTALGVSSKTLEDAKLDLQTTQAENVPKATEHHAAVEKAHEEAKAVVKKAELDLNQLKDNPGGIPDPHTGKPILPPSKDELTALKVQLTAKATKQADAIVAEENQAATAKNAARLSEREMNVKAALDAQAALNGSPRAARRGIKAERVLQDNYKAASKKLVEAEARHADNQRQLDRVEIATKTRKPQPGAAANAPPDYIDPSKRAMDAVGMTTGERDTLRRNAPQIRLANMRSAKTLDAARTTAADARVARDTAVAAVDAALEQHAGPKPPSRLVSAQTRRDLRRAYGVGMTPVVEFLESPSGAKLRAMAGAFKPGLKGFARRTYRDAKSAGKELFDDYFTRDDGKGVKRIHIPKVIAGIAPFASLVAAGKIDLTTLKDRYLHPDAETRAEARRKPMNLQFEERVDPITGAGYFAAHMPDPRNKGERTMVYGERFDGSDTVSTRLHAGGTLRETRQKVAEREANRQKTQQNNGRPGGSGPASLSNLPQDTTAKVNAALPLLRSGGNLETVGTYAGGPTFEVRQEGHNLQNDTVFGPAAQAVTNHIRATRGLRNRSPASAADYYGTLRDLFSKEAATLKSKQTFRELTAWDTKGDANKDFHPVFAANQEFRSQDSAVVLSGLTKEVSRALTQLPPTTLEQADNLHRAIAVVGKAKNLDKGALAALHAQVLAATTHLTTAAAATPPPFSAGTPAGAAAPRPAPQAAPATPPAPEAGADRSVPAHQPEQVSLATTSETAAGDEWTPATATRFAAQAGNRIAGVLGETDPKKIAKMRLAIYGIARSIDRKVNLDDQLRIGAVERAMMHLHTSKPEGLRSILMSANPGDTADQDRLFQARLTAEVLMLRPGGTGLGKAALPGARASSALDDFDALLKISMGGFEESLHPRVGAGAAGGGEFAAGGSGAGSEIAGKAVSEGVEAAGKAAGKREAAAPVTQAWAHPVRLGTELGGALGSEIGIKVASAVTHLLPGGAGKALGFLADGAAAMYAGDYGGDAGEHAGQAAFRTLNGTKRAPGYAPPELHDLGEGLSGAAGGMGGGILGNTAGAAVGMFAGRAIGGTLGAAVGGPVGSVLLGTAAGYAGEKVAGGIYRLFAGYDHPTVTKALTRFGAKPVRG